MLLERLIAATPRPKKLLNHFPELFNCLVTKTCGSTTSNAVTFILDALVGL